MSSPIRDFYSGKSIFLTGATGFIGKALVEKLLRSCDGIENIYILIRQKKAKTAEQRWKDYINDTIFEFQGIKKSVICQKLVPIFGDISMPGFGLSMENKQILIDNVSVVLHVAGFVKFNPPLRRAINTNLLSTISIIELCRQIKRLDCLVYVSTVAVLCNINTNKEKVYSTPVSPEHVIESCKKLTLQQIEKYTQLIFPDFPFTYSISKALAEQVLLRESGRINIAIVRPPGTASAYREPVPGWVQGLHGPTFLSIMAGLGIMRIIPFNSKLGQLFIPVDFVVNATIASSWYVSSQREKNKLQVYHMTTQAELSPSINQIMKIFESSAIDAPSKRVIRPPAISFIKNEFQIKFEGFFKHWVFAYIIDLIAKLIGNKANMVNTISYMTSNIKLISLYIKRLPQFEIDNTIYLINQMSPIDRKEFYFDVRSIDWKPYYKNLWMSLRRHVLKEKDCDILDAREILKKVTIKHRILNSLWILLVTTILYLIWYLICSYCEVNKYFLTDFLFKYPTTVMELLWLFMIPFLIYVGFKLIKVFEM